MMLPNGSRQQFFVDVEMATREISMNIVEDAKKKVTHVSTRPSARHDPSPFSPQVTIHRPSTFPAPSIVSATVSSEPGRTPTASSDGNCTDRASSHRANARVVSHKNAGSYTRVVSGDSVSVSVVISIPAGTFSLCECEWAVVVVCPCSCSCSCLCGNEGGDEGEVAAAALAVVVVVVARLRKVVTYGLPHHATSAVDTPDVASAVVASAARAVDGREDSTMNMKGERELASASEEREKILRRRKVRVRGPTYITDDDDEGYASASDAAPASVLLLLSLSLRVRVRVAVASAVAVDRDAVVEPEEKEDEEGEETARRGVCGCRVRVGDRAGMVEENGLDRTDVVPATRSTALRVKTVGPSRCMECSCWYCRPVKTIDGPMRFPQFRKTGLWTRGASADRKRSHRGTNPNLLVPLDIE